MPPSPAGRLRRFALDAVIALSAAGGVFAGCVQGLMMSLPLSPDVDGAAVRRAGDRVTAYI